MKIPNIEDNPSFDAQSTPDATDWSALLALAGQTGVVQGCAVTPHGADMNVSVAVGVVYIGGKLVGVAAVTSLAIGAASATDRKDIVVVDNTGAVSVVAGTACGTAGWVRTSVGLPPVKPAIPANSTILAEVYVASTTTTIASGNIIDKTPIIQPMFSGGPALPMVPGGNYYTGDGVTSVGTAANPTNGVAHYIPKFVATPTAIDQMAIRTVTTNGSAGALIRLGIYYDNGAGKPGKLLLDAGTVDSTAAVGVLTKTVSITLQPGLYWLCAVPQGAPTTQATIQTLSPQVSGLGPYTLSSGATTYGWTQTAVTGALADAGTLTAQSTALAPAIRAQ